MGASKNILKINEETKIGLDRLKKVIYFSTGFISLFLGLIGVFLPILPTTPFILLSAYLFAQSSKKYHEWLRNNRHFGKTIRSWESGRGLTNTEKWKMLVIVTLAFAISLYFCTNTIGRIILLILYPVPVTIALLTRTNREQLNRNHEREI